MKKVDFDDYADNYEKLTRENVNFFSSDDSYFARIKVRLVRKYIQCEPRRIIEYGAGVGRNLPYLMQSFPKAEIWACDISEKSLQKIGQNFPAIKTFMLDGDLDPAIGAFDLIFIAGVFHHIEPAVRDTVAAQVATLMSGQSELFVFEHNPYNPVTRRLVDRCPYDEDAVLLKPLELRQILVNGGLEIKRTGYYLFFPPFLKLGALESGLSTIPLGGQYFVRAVKG